MLKADGETVEQVAMDSVVLRRISWMVFCSIVILGIGIGMLAAIYKVTSVNGFRTGWQGIPVYLAFAGFIGRIANCKVILRGDALLVVNPLRTHIVSKVMIRGASVGDDGTLDVDLNDDRNIPVFAFGGSLVDHFKGTSGEAARKISSWLHSGRTVSDGKATVQVRWTRCVAADLSLILCAVISGVGAIWMALSGS